MNVDDFCSFFQCYSILAEKQRTKQINYDFLNLSASLDTQDTLQGGITVEWKKFRQEIPVCISIPTLKYQINEQGGRIFSVYYIKKRRGAVFFVYYMKKCKQGGKNSENQ